MITDDDVRDLREGDVVRLDFPSGSFVQGPLKPATFGGGGLEIIEAGWPIRASHGGAAASIKSDDNLTLHVVLRAPRTLYVNSDRAEPALGDVVRNAGDLNDTRTWSFCEDNRDKPWRRTQGNAIWANREDLPEKLHLLVDGMTGWNYE